MTALLLPLLLAANLNGVQGAEKTATFPSAAKEALAKDDFTVLEGAERHFFSLYDRNAYERVPSFISVDVVLHVFHTRFDDEVAALEVEELVPALKSFATGQLQLALSKWPAQGAPDPAIESLTLFHAVAVALLDESASLDPRIAASATTEAKLLRAARGTLSSKACGAPIDATLFLPRGHYDRWDLRGYFQASNWYAQCVFPLDRRGLPGALNVARLIDAKAAASLRELEAACTFLAGPADDPGFTQLEPLLAGVSSPIPPKTLDALVEKARALPKGKIASPRGPVFALLGGARTFDAELLGAVAKSRTPSSLDVLAALGSTGALRLLAKAPSGPTLERGAGISQRWLDVLALLVGKAPEGQPPYAKTSAWEGRVLTSAAGSWAELKHDTLLYVKQPIVMREGGDDAELPASRVGGYVDPRPDVYRALLELNDSLRTLTPEQKDDGLGDFLRFVIEVSELELANKPFPKKLDERLRTVGSELEHLARMRGDQTPRQALVADVATIEWPEKPREVLHAGVGDVDELWVVVPRAGKRVLMRGGVFSYYEFTRPERLDDQRFMELLASSPPPRPLWARPVPQVRAKKRKD